MSLIFFQYPTHVKRGVPCGAGRTPEKAARRSARTLTQTPTLLPVKKWVACLFGVAVAAMFTNAAYADSADCEQDASDAVPAVCAHAAYIEADAKLHDAYQSALNLLSADNKFVRAKTQLIASQREWLRFRESDCKVRSELAERGETRESMTESCMVELTEQRTDELQQIWLP